MKLNIHSETSSLVQLCPKGPFSGSEVSFAVALPEADTQRAWDVLAIVQDAMEPLIMVAPPMMVHLRIQGFTEQVVPPCTTFIVRST